MFDFDVVTGPTQPPHGNPADDRSASDRSANSRPSESAAPPVAAVPPAPASGSRPESHRSGEAGRLS